MKKVVKIVLALVIVLIIALALIPILFQDKLVALIKENINNNVNAKVEFADADLSLFRNFPNASIKLTDVSVVNFEPFKGDTLFYGKEIDLSLKVTQLLNNESEGLTIKSFSVDDAKVNVLVNPNGKANYDIAKKTTEEKQIDTTSKKASKLSIDAYKIANSDIVYNDKKGKIFLKLLDLNHSGKGDFSKDKTQLETSTSSQVSFTIDKSNYLENQHIDLDAVLDLDLKENKFSFLKNEAHINQLPLIFDGFLKLNDNNQEIDVNFKTPSSDFKNFLALIPKQYAKNIADVKTTGNFSVVGKIQGVVDQKHIPRIDVAVASNNASFKYPNLPKSVKNIHINASVKNTTGLAKNTFVDIGNLSFKIDENTFKSNAKINSLTKNPKINATLKGKLNLADLDKVYPIKTDHKLSGVINADLTSSFDVDALKKNIYQRIKNQGRASISNFVYASKDVVNPINIKNANVDFKPTKITLTQFDAKTGSTDLKATGTINNLLGFLLSNKKLQGSFTLNSNEFRVSDFMESSSDSISKNNPAGKNMPKEALKIPAFLDCSINANAKKVYYDNLILENAKGSLMLKDEKAVLKGVNANLLGGSVNLNGAVNTQNKTPLFDMKLGVKSFDISQSFSKLKLFQALSPIAGILQGKINTNIDLKGNLKNNFTPNLLSVSGDALAQVLTQKLNPKKSKTLGLLNDKLKFIDFNRLNLDNVKTSLAFKGGKVHVKPFTVKYKDIAIKIEGSHSFDKVMNYDVTCNVPAKYLGGEVTGLLAKLGDKEKNMTVPVTASLSGNFTNPTVKTDLKSAINNLTTQLIERQKNKLIDKALGGLLGGNKKNDSTKTTAKDNLKRKVGNILGGLLGGKKKKKKKETTKKE